MTQITDEMVERAFAKFTECCNAMHACPKCKGEGYHHGFGEHGHDPDWCENCGGSQYVPQFDDKESMRAALSAAMTSQNGKTP